MAASTAIAASPVKAVKEPAKEKPEKVKAERKVAGFALTATITLLADKEGKPYGKTNNPKRAGKASAGRFELYKNGMTLKQALDAGVTTGDIAWDRDHGYIEIAA